MANTDTLLLVSERKSMRQKLRLIFEEEYNLLECKQIDLSWLMLQQNAQSIAATILDMRNADDGEIEKIRTLCRDAKKQEIPVIVLLGRLTEEIEALALEAGAVDVLSEKCSAAIIRRRVQNVTGLCAEKNRLKSLVESQSEMILHANEMLIDTLSSLIEYRSAESGMHVLRIRRFTKILLEEVARTCPEYGLSEHTIAEVVSAAALHDIGKIAIPDAILNKPGKLLPAERKVIETHSNIGAQIIEKMSGVVDPQYLKYAYNISKYHHERWDGKGYPAGLEGDDIPICAQVVGLADVYDALTTRRVYKDAYAQDTAVQMILNGECGHFSPKLLECFKAVRKEFFDLARFYSDDRAALEDRVVDLELPGPVHQQEISSLHRTQNKYHLLLNHLNATVVELDAAIKNYHVVYNPTSSLALLNTGKTFRESIENLLNHYAAQQERGEVADAIFSHLDEMMKMGIKRLMFRIAFGGEDSRRYAYEITLLNTNWIEAENRTLLMIWNRIREESDEQVFQQGEDAMQQLFGEIENRCVVRNDRYLTIEDNSAVAMLLGYTPNSFAERFRNRLVNVVVQEDRYTLVPELQRQLESDGGVEMILRLQHISGQNAHVLFRGKPCVNHKGEEQIVGVLVRIEGIYQERKRMKEDIDRFVRILDQQEHAIFEWSMDSDEFVYVKNWEKIFGYDPKGKKISALLHNSTKIHPDDHEKIISILSHGLMGKKNVNLDVRILRQNGRYTWQRFNAVAEFDKDQKAKRITGILFNVDQEKRSEQMLLHKTEVDALTRLLNKDAGRKYTEDILADQQDQEQSALILIDLDNFKSVNDRYGHMFGDAVLCEAAMVIRKHFRPDDVIARIGGDEFMVMMRPNVTRELIHMRCDALCRALKTQLEKLIQEGDVSASIGIALAPEHANNYSELFQRADQALYFSKKNGKNTYSLYDSENAAYLQLQIPESFNTRIESDEGPGLADSSIVRYAFKRLYEAKNEEEAINSILAMIGEQMNVDRVYIFENSPDNQYCSNTFEWCHEGVTPQIDILQNIHYERDVTGFLESFNEQGIFYCPDVEKLSEPVYSVVKMQGIKSMLACAIREKGVFRGYVGFDECTEERIWTKEQIDALVFFSEMLSVFLIKMRIQRKTTQYVDNLTSILNSRPECIYVVDADSYEIRFANANAKKIFDGIDIGKRCFEAVNGVEKCCDDCPTRKAQIGANSIEEVECMKLGWQMNVEASVVSWQGNKAYLLVCRLPETEESDHPALGSNQ